MTRETISMQVPEVVRSWPEERNTTESRVTFRAFSNRSPVSLSLVGFCGWPLSILKVTVPPAAWDRTGCFLLRLVLGEPEAHEQPDGGEHGGGETAQGAGDAQAVAGQQPVAVQQSTLGTGGVGPVVTGHLHVLCGRGRA